MRQLPDSKLGPLAEAIEAGLSAAQIAKTIGISERTARTYRTYLTLPEKCGCGRPLKHLGRCNWRRQQTATHSGKSTNAAYDTALIAGLERAERITTASMKALSTDDNDPHQDFRYAGALGVRDAIRAEITRLRKGAKAK